MARGMAPVCKVVADIVIEKIFPMYEAMGGFCVGGTRATRDVSVYART